MTLRHILKVRFDDIFDSEDDQSEIMFPSLKHNQAQTRYNAKPSHQFIPSGATSSDMQRVNDRMEEEVSMLLSTLEIH
jgi:hypothetical protein